MCPLAACWTCYPRDLNMALAMTTQIEGFQRLLPRDRRLEAREC